MNEETKTALLGSIEKWKEIENGTGEDHGTSNCPLCHLFIGSSCNECPVKKATGTGGCEDSPYISWLNHVHKIHGKELWKTGLKVHCPECKELATAERKFLEGLLED